MPPSQRVPAYRLHKPSGQARVIVDGKHVYLVPVRKCTSLRILGMRRLME